MIVVFPDHTLYFCKLECAVRGLNKLVHEFASLKLKAKNTSKKGHLSIKWFDFAF